jgi:hypothetical protein
MGVRWAPRTGDESHGDDAVVYVIPSAARNRDHPARGPSFGKTAIPRLPARMTTAVSAPADARSAYSSPDSTPACSARFQLPA